MNLMIHKWATRHAGAMTVDAIRAVFHGRGEHRIRRAIWPPGTQFSGAMRAAHFFVLSGSCVLRLGPQMHEIELTAGEFIEIPEGEYSLSATGDIDFDAVTVWRLTDQIA